ncbi:MAG: hypothetical protein AAFO07_09460 [Bacteroidota bacterium]
MKTPNLHTIVISAFILFILYMLSRTGNRSDQDLYGNFMDIALVLTAVVSIFLLHLQSKESKKE